MFACGVEQQRNLECSSRLQNDLPCFKWDIKFPHSTFKHSLKTFLFQLRTIATSRDGTKLGSVKHHRSSCRRRTKSTVDLI